MNKHNIRARNENNRLLCEMRNYCTDEHTEVYLNLLIWVCGLEAFQENCMLFVISFNLYVKPTSSCCRHNQRSVSVRISAVAACSCVICNSTLFLCTSWGLPIEISLFFHSFVSKYEKNDKEL